MHAIVPQLVRKRSPLSLKALCLRSLSSVVANLGSLPADLGEALMKECQDRFTMEDANVFRRFFAVPIRHWTARELFLEEPNLFDEAFVAWCSSLMSLDLWSVSLSAETLSLIGARFPHLKRLSLNRVPGLDDHVAGALFSEALCSRLEVLSLTDLAEVSDKGLVQMGVAGKSLRFLRVEHCPQVQDSVLQMCRCAGSALVEVHVSADDALAKVLASDCPSLRVLDLHGGDVTDRGMRPLLRKIAARLTNLNLSHTAVSCATLDALRAPDDEELPLEELNLSLLYNVTKQAVENLLYCCPKLKMLSLKDNDEVDDETIDVLCTCCTELRDLNVSKCNLLTDAGIGQVVAELNQLATLNVRKCDQISDRMRALLKKIDVRVLL